MVSVLHFIAAIGKGLGTSVYLSKQVPNTDAQKSRSAEIYFGSEKGCEFLSEELRPLLEPSGNGRLAPSYPALLDRMLESTWDSDKWRFPSIAAEVSHAYRTHSNTYLTPISGN
jgi:hypothetical protein